MYKCHFCQSCDGMGCIGEMPGMGGPNASRNFLHNCEAWERIARPAQESVRMPDIRLAPVTGAVENVGYDDERSFYFDLIDYCLRHGIKLSIGDGTPDCKLLYGIQAVQAAGERYPGTKAAVFIKPYPQEKVFERIEWALPVAEGVGMDIDSYNIITMRNLVHLEKKTPAQLRGIKTRLEAAGLPFAIKGVFTAEDVETVAAVKPAIAYISNHGGRVDTREGSTAEFLEAYAEKLRANCGELWIDGGIRSQREIALAAAYGVSTVLEGRPFITALCRERLSAPEPGNGKEAYAEKRQSFNRSV